MVLIVVAFTVSLLTASAQEDSPISVETDESRNEPQYEWDPNGYVIFCPCMG